MMGERDSSIATIDGSDTVYDAPIEKPILRAMFCIFVAGGLGFTALGATNTGGHGRSEWLAIADSACVFAADIVGTETIAKGSSGK
jgi:hypothetical protein